MHHGNSVRWIHGWRPVDEKMKKHRIIAEKNFVEDSVGEETTTAEKTSLDKIFYFRHHKQCLGGRCGMLPK